MTASRCADEAMACCMACDVLAECSAWLHSLPVDARPVGVIAGERWTCGDNGSITRTGRVGRPSTTNRKGKW